MVVIRIQKEAHHVARTTMEYRNDFLSVLTYFIFWPHSMWNLSSLTRDKPVHPALEAWSHNHWTAREVLEMIFSGGPYPGEETLME